MTSMNPQSIWQSTLQAWREAGETYRAHPYPNTSSNHPDYERLDEEASALSEAEARALDAVMECPAPNYTALIRKLEIITAEFGDDFYISHLIDDVRRLSELTEIFPLQTRSVAIAGSPSPDSLEPANTLSGSPAGFDAARWLFDFSSVGGGWVVCDRVMLITRLDGQADDERNKAGELVAMLSAEDRAAITAYLREGRAHHG